MKLLLIALILIVGNAFADTSSTDVPAPIKGTLEKNILAANTGDLDAYMSTIHTNSEGYSRTQVLMRDLFNRYDLRNTILSMQYEGGDDEYGFVRVRFTTEKIKGPDFQNTSNDVLFIFRKLNSEWKLWNQSILETTGKEFVPNKAVEGMAPR